MQLTQDVNKEKHADLNIEPIILFNKEKSSLLPLPKQNIMNEYLENYKRIKVTSESLIRFSGKAYSVDPQYINCLVEVQEENNKLKEENTTLKSNAINLERYFKKLKRDSEKQIEELKKENKRLLEENYNLKNKQINLEDYR